MIGTRLMELTGAEGIGVLVGKGATVLVGSSVASTGGSSEGGTSVGSTVLVGVLAEAMGAVDTAMGDDGSVVRTSAAGDSAFWHAGSITMNARRVEAINFRIRL